jgi:DNA-binding response OmpR family regulator
LIGDKRTKEKGIIVVIDDDKNVVFTLEHALKEQGYKPILASTGSEGVRLAKDLKPSCIVLEIAVRSGDGLGACRMLKKMPFTRKIPVIVLTASRDVSDRETALQNGVEEYLIKPIVTSAILSKIGELTEDE